VAPERHHGRKRCRSRAQMMSHACTNDVAPEQQTLIRETLSGDSERETKTLSAPDVGSPDEKKATDASDLFPETETEQQAPPKKKRGDRHSATDDGGTFAQFWAAYPKRVAKEAARKAFAKAIEHGTDPGTLTAGAQRYAVERQGQDPKYTKHPATWLN